MNKDNPLYSNEDVFSIDCHIHSRYSADAYLRSCKPNKILKRAFSCGLDSIVVTDTNQDRFFDRVYAGIKKDILGMKIAYQDQEMIMLQKKSKFLYLLRGMEIHDDKGHLLVIGGKKEIMYNPNDSILDRIKRAHDGEGIIGPAHVYNVAFGGIGGKNLEELQDKFDFMEIFNPLDSQNNNALALAASKKYNLPGLSNSDDHNSRPGRGSTNLSLNLDISIEKLPGEIKNSIKQGKILDYNCNYTSVSEKLWIFLAKEILNGNFKPIPDRIRKSLMALREGV